MLTLYAPTPEAVCDWRRRISECRRTIRDLEWLAARNPARAGLTAPAVAVLNEEIATLRFRTRQATRNTAVTM